MFEVVEEQPLAEEVYVKVADPASKPVTTPVLLSIEAIVGLLLIQFPPVFGDKAIVLPMQTEPGPDKTGGEYTVTVAVTVVVHPPLVTL